MLDTIEWVPVTLPSHGRLYKDKIPGGKVEITPWTVAQEETILRLGEEDAGVMLRKLTENNIRLPGGVSYEDLLSTDHHFLLVQLRCVSYVPWYTTVHVCPSCGKPHAEQIDLQSLEVRVPDADEVYTEPVGCFLPKKKKEVQLRYLRVRDEAAATAYAASSAGAQPHTVRQMTYARQIESVDGQSLKFDERMAFVLSLPLLDLEAINRRLNSTATGITGRIPTKCPNCQKEDLAWSPPLHVNFFRPAQVDIERGVGSQR